eukprot:scaffold164967_cov51-Prasinocladus_malaysianus.AAC.2
MFWQGSDSGGRLGAVVQGYIRGSVSSEGVGEDRRRAPQVHTIGGRHIHLCCARGQPCLTR